MHAHRVLSGNDETSDLIVLEIALGPGVANIARGMFSALRELDRENVGAIVVEGIDDSEGETAAAIMNRLRKAAETTAET
jgi:L-threonylcarbamoyladenylate synthase